MPSILIVHDEEQAKLYVHPAPPPPNHYPYSWTIFQTFPKTIKVRYMEYFGTPWMTLNEELQGRMRTY